MAQRADVADALHSAAVRLLRHARAADVEMDLDGPRASLLSVLVFGGPQSVSRLARVEQVSPPAVTKMVDALVAAGFVRRERSTTDRRVVNVAATPAGRRLIDRGRAARVRAVETLLEDATPEDLAALRRAAEVVARALAVQAGGVRR
jgi:DNA-binding MarR family transcriptional regulator